MRLQPRILEQHYILVCLFQLLKPAILKLFGENTLTATTSYPHLVQLVPRKVFAKVKEEKDLQIHVCYDFPVSMIPEFIIYDLKTSESFRNILCSLGMPNG